MSTKTFIDYMRGSYHFQNNRIYMYFYQSNIKVRRKRNSADVSKLSSTNSLTNFLDSFRIDIP